MKIIGIAFYVEDSPFSWRGYGYYDILQTVYHIKRNRIDKEFYK